MKRALSLLLALVLLVGLVPMQAFATEGTPEAEAVEVVAEPAEAAEAPEEETTAPAEETEETGSSEPEEDVEKTQVPYDQLSTVWPSINTDLTHIICYGQSFSTGSDAPYYSDAAVDNVYVYGGIANSTKGTELKHLTASAGNQHPVISAGNVFAKLLDRAGIETDIVLGSYGSGGKTIAQLMSAQRQSEIKEEEGYTYDILSSGRYEIFQSSVSALAQYAQKNAQSISCPAIVYLQGETDQNTDAQLGYPDNPARAGYGAGGDKAKYKEYMSRLKEDMQREVMEQYGQTEKPLFVIYQVSGTYTRTQYSSINMAQIEFAQENKDVILVQTPYFTSHYTNSHHLTQNGYRWLGEYIGRSIYTALVERVKPWPMLPERIEITSSNSVRITVKGAQNGLSVDTWTVEDASNSKNLYGFYLMADGKNIVPTNVTVQGNTIELTLPADLTSETVYVYYAGKNASGTGNIRDNSTELGFYEYLDDSNDTGTGNNQGVSHSALDANGNSIIGQKYPMYNWLASFCYEVEVPEAAQRQAAYYHWEMREAGLTSVTDGNAVENELTLVQGTVENGILNKVQYTMEKTVVLEHNRPWVIEWKAAGNGNSYGGGKLLGSSGSNDSYAQYLYTPADTRGLIAWGVSALSANYGFQVSKHGIDHRQEHTYRIENRIDADGVNTIYLLVDGAEIGPMNTGYRISSNTSGPAGSMIEEPYNWANGKNLYMDSIGAGGSFLLNNLKLSYLKVWEGGQHIHSYTTAVTAPTCTEQGYTTHTCACGDSYVDDYTDESGYFNATAETLSDGEKLVLTELNVIKHNKSLIFSANVTDLGDGLIRISHGQNAYGGNHLEITADKILVYTTNTNTSVKEYSHGLDVSGDVYVRLDAPRSKVNITIITASGTYKKTVAWNGCNGDISCAAEGTTLQNVDLRWFATGIQSDYWFFGDSWFNTTSSARWTSYLLDDGYTDVLLAAYPGMRAPAGLAQFRELLTLDTPKYAIWALGMNNGDKNGAVNESWLTSTEEFLRLCEQYGVAPILCTIPTTPKVNNRLKNEWIKNSGYRYIDFDMVVVENYATGEWFEGMAASDLNHPDTPGAKVLYPQVFADFPELASGDPATCTHKLYQLDARTGNCKNGGRNEYYVCSLCGGAFKDAEATISTTTAEMLLPPVSHTYVDGICTVCGTENPGPIIIRQPADVEADLNEKFRIAVEAEGESLTYQWYVKEAGAKAFKVSSNKTSAYAYAMQHYMNGRQVYCVITDQYGNSVTTETATITRSALPVQITEQPSDVYAEMGETFSVKVKAEGEGLTYQWYYKNANGKSFAASSIKKSSYSSKMVSYMVGRQVYCVVTDKYGNQVTSDVVTIDLPAKTLEIVTQPVDVHAPLGQKFSIAPEVQGEGLTYQWYYKNKGGKSFAASSNKTVAYSYSMTNYMNGRQVYCVITDQFGNQVTTDIATITLAPEMK